MIPYLFLSASLVSCFVKLGDANCKNGIIENGVSAQDAEFIVKKHNDLRQQVACGQLKNQPKGLNLKKLKYSPELAYRAQKTANKCEFDKTDDSGTPWGYVGENKYKEMTTHLMGGSDWNNPLQAWIDKNKEYKFSGSNSGANSGLYTQMVWADTEYVGCAYTSFQDKSAKYEYNKYYICYYGPGGNIIGQKPYKLDKKSQGCNKLL